MLETGIPAQRDSNGGPSEQAVYERHILQGHWGARRSRLLTKLYSRLTAPTESRDVFVDEQGC